MPGERRRKEPAKSDWVVVEELTVSDSEMLAPKRYRYLADDQGNLSNDRSRAKIYQSRKEAYEAAKIHGLRAVEVE